VSRTSFLGSGIVEIGSEGWPLLAAVLGLQAVVFPFIRFGLLASSLAALRFDVAGPWVGQVFRWGEQLDHWAMPDVFLFGAAVGDSRVVAFIPVTIGSGGWCLIAAAFLAMLSRATLDRRSIWHLIGQPVPLPDGPRIACTECDLVLPAHQEGGRCLRCRAPLRCRKRDSLVRTAALVAAGFLFYPVANYFPMSVQYRLGETMTHTITTGVEDLFGAGLWPLGIVIFCTSIAIPLLKLVGLSWMMWCVHRGSRNRLLLRTRLYRVIEEIGRWSNIDVFTIAVFAPLMQAAPLLKVGAGKGAPAFLAVIVLTMFAVRAFDPRLVWDVERKPA
jgi:paraquat-inducible protein A